MVSLYFLNVISSISPPLIAIVPLTFSFSKLILSDDLMASSLVTIGALLFSKFTLGALDF